MERTLQTAAVTMEGPAVSARSGWPPMFLSIVSFVGAVSLYDGYLVIRTGDMILQFEQNPVGVYLLRCDGGHPDLFLRVKAAGTLLVLSALCFLQRHAARFASPVAFAIAVFQGGLLIFLEGPFQ